MAHRCICLNCLGKIGDVALPEGVSLAVDFKASKPTPGPFSLSLSTCCLWIKMYSSQLLAASRLDANGLTL